MNVPAPRGHCARSGLAVVYSKRHAQYLMLATEGTASKETKMSAVQSFLESITPQQLFLDPYPIYEQLRKDAPVAYLPQLHLYWVTRFDDVAEVLATKDRWVSASSQKSLRRTLGDPVITLVGGAVHDDLRAGVDKKLQPRPITRIIE